MRSIARKLLISCFISIDRRSPLPLLLSYSRSAWIPKHSVPFFVSFCSRFAGLAQFRLVTGWIWDHFNFSSFFFILFNDFDPNVTNYLWNWCQSRYTLNTPVDLVVGLALNRLKVVYRKFNADSLNTKKCSSCSQRTKRLWKFLVSTFVFINLILIGLPLVR